MTNKEQLDSISKYFETILVDNSEGKLETVEVVREKRGYKNLKKINDYRLKEIACNHSLFFSICQDLTSFEEIETNQMKYLKFNFLQRIFYGNKEKKLIELVKKMSNETSWLIIPSFLTETFAKYTNFTSNFIQEDKMLVGSFEQINILLNPNIGSKEIYFGNYNSFKVIVNKNNLDFLLLDRNKIKLLKLV